MIRGGGFLVPFADVQEAFLRRQIQWRHFTDEFPVIGSKIPVLRNNFPVNWSRELLLSDYSAALSCTKNVFRSLKIVEFTAKFPDSTGLVGSVGFFKSRVAILDAVLPAVWLPRKGGSILMRQIISAGGGAS
jgi:hypothetical protein